MHCDDVFAQQNDEAVVYTKWWKMKQNSFGPVFVFGCAKKSMFVCFPIGLASRLEKSLLPSAADLSLVKTLLIPQLQREDSNPNKIGQTCTIHK